MLISITGFSQDLKIEKVATKLKGDVYSPAFFRDKIVVTSNQKARLIKTVLDEQNSNTSDLYTLVDNAGNYVSFDQSFKTDFNDGPITFDRDGGYAVLTRNVFSDRRLNEYESGKNPLGLFESSINASGWSPPILLPFVDSSYQYVHPGLSADGKTLVFASNRPNGYGGFDIYFSYKSEKGWSEPENAGSEINSDKNELFPSIAGQNVFFSSDRVGMGGLDIFMYNSSSQIRTQFEAPINSEKDDFGLISNDDFTEGYFSSNRGGKDEIWSFSNPKPKHDNCDELVPNTLCYSLSEAQSVEFDDTQPIIYRWNINGTSLYGISIDYCFPSEGAYEISLDVIDTVINETFYNQSYYYLEIAFELQPYISSPDTVVPGQKFKLSTEKTNLPDAQITSYAWEISDGTQMIGNSIEHTFNETGTYNIQLGAEGTMDGEPFTDCVYKTIYCLDQKSLTAIKNQQDLLTDTSKVIDKRHFFEEINDSSNVVYSIEIVRTDKKLENDNFLFKLMETYGEVKIHYVEEDSQYAYMIGAWEKLEDAHPTWRELIANGHKDAVVRTIDINKIQNFQVDNSFVLDNVRFDESSWTIRKDAIPDIENIIDIMLIFPDIELKIEAHTDSNGDEIENIALSLKRAESVKGYIVSKGIDPIRITASGLGESKPKESNDTPEGQEINRRVEFTFIK